MNRHSPNYLIIIGFSLCLAWISIPAATQDLNPDRLRRDMTMGLDRIGLQFDRACLPSPDTRSLGLGVDRIRLLTDDNRELLLIDVGTAQAYRYLGQGWYGAENWGGITGCWGNALAGESTCYCAIPETARTLELVCQSACQPVTTSITLNGHALAQFSLPTYSGWQAIRIPLPVPIQRTLELKLIDPGPLGISGIDWLDSNGNIAATQSFSAFLNQAGDTALQTVMIPPGAGDFRMRFQTSAATGTTLQVKINQAAAFRLAVPAGAVEATTLEPDALERQADRWRVDDGWGVDLGGRRSGNIYSWPGSEYPGLTDDGDAVTFCLPGLDKVVQLQFLLPEALSLDDFPYLSVRLKATSGSMYFIRPEGLDASGHPVLLWYESSPTDDRIGTGDWETISVSLPRLAQDTGTGATAIDQVSLLLGSNGVPESCLAVDWICVHRAFPVDSPDRQERETDFGNHLDEDADGLLDRDDTADATAGGFGRKLVMAWYHPWFGTPYGPVGWWSGWSGQQQDYSIPDQPPVPTGVVWDPNTFDPAFPGKRNLATVYYPLAFWNHPDYVPPAAGAYRYDLYGGVEQVDNLSPTYLRREIALAQEYGLDGFVINTGGRDLNSFAGQVANALAAGSSQRGPFRFSVLYDWYYRLPEFNLMDEKPDYRMALDLIYYHATYGTHPRWLYFEGQPVYTAPFLSFLISAEKWRRVEEIFLDPASSDFDGLLDPVARQPGFGNQLELVFEKAEQPGGGDDRFLSVAIDKIQCLDANLKVISCLDVGTSAARAHLLSGWSSNENWPGGQTIVWTAGPQRRAVAELELPSQAVFLELAGQSFPESNLVTLRLNGGPAARITATRTMTSFVFRLADNSKAAPMTVDRITFQPDSPRSARVTETQASENPTNQRDGRPFALFLDSTAAAPAFDGFASYSSFLSGRGCLVSDRRPLLLTVGCGYDDRKIRYPGSFTDRQNGALYRQQWESALAQDPDIVFINTWSEWAEGTIIAPTVEFGYRYLELTLTYALILQEQLITSQAPSALGLTIRRYHFTPSGTAEILLQAERSGTIRFCRLPLTVDQPGQWTVTRDGLDYQSYTLNPAEAKLTLELSPPPAEYRIVASGLPAVNLSALAHFLSENDVGLECGGSCADFSGDGLINATALMILRVFNENWRLRQAGGYR